MLSRNKYCIKSLLYSYNKIIYQYMNYDLIIVKINNPHSKKVLAHKIAADPAISMQKALSLLENLPAVYMKDLSTKELEEASDYLVKIGVVCRAVESRDPFVQPGITTIPKPQEHTIQQHTIKEHVQAPKMPAVSQPVSISLKPHLDNTQKGSEASNPKKKKIWPDSPGARMAIIASIIFILILLILQGKNRYFGIDLTSISKKGAPQTTDTSAQSQNELQQQDTAAKNTTTDSGYSGIESRESGVTPAQQKISGEYADSAADMRDDYERAIKLYKIAISFNQNNVSAWQGLLATYTKAGMSEQAVETKNRMEEIFGNTVFTIGTIIGPYGVLSSFNLDDNRVCRIEYRSRKMARHELEEETYNIARALLGQLHCSQLSLYAATTKGSGMLVRLSNSRSFPATLSEFRRTASLSFVE